MSKALILLAFMLKESFSLPTLKEENLSAQRLNQANNIPVAYLAGDDCNTCMLGINNTVGMFRFDTAQWCFGEPTPFIISEHSAAALGNDGYVITGFGEEIDKPLTERTYLKTVFAYNSINNTYTQVADLQVGRQQSSAVSVGDKIYVVGGLTRSADDGNLTEIFDGQNWTFGEQTLVPRYGHVVVNIGNYLWLVGGLEPVSPYRCLKSTEYLNLNSPSDGWQQGPPMHTARGFPGAAVTKNKVILVCGGSNKKENFQNCEELEVNNDGSPAGYIWYLSLAFMSHPREDFTMITYNNKTYAVGGYWPDIRSDYAATSVEEYDPAIGDWSDFYQAPSNGPFPNNCLGCRAALMYVPEIDMTC